MNVRGSVPASLVATLRLRDRKLIVRDRDQMKHMSDHPNHALHERRFVAILWRCGSRQREHRNEEQRNSKSPGRTRMHTPLL